MNSKPFSAPEHHATLANWWRGWNLPVTPVSFLSEGLVVFNENEEPVCAGFVYQLGRTPLYWIEGIVSNPASSKADRVRALEVLVSGLTEIAKRDGCELLMASTPRESLGELFKGAGFNPAPEKYLHMGRLV